MRFWSKLCHIDKYGITSIQLPWLILHLTNQIWGELFTSTTTCPSNDQRAMRREFRSVPSRGLPTIDSFGFVNFLHHTIHSLCCSCWYKFRDRPSSRFKKLSFYTCPKCKLAKLFNAAYKVGITRRVWIKVITKLPNSVQSYKGKVKTHNYINRQNQSTTGKLWKP